MANEDRAYTDWLRTLPCAACSNGPSVVHHRTGAGMGLRAHDHDGIPLCDPCHRSLHDRTHGHFKGWSKLLLRAWQDEQVRQHRERFLVRGDGLPW